MSNESVTYFLGLPEFKPNSKSEKIDFAESSTAMLLQKNLQVMEEKMSEEENEKRLKFEYEVCAKTLDYLALVVFVSLFIMITLAYIAATMSHSVLHHQ